MESGKCDALIMLALLYSHSYNKFGVGQKHKLTFQQKLGFEVINYKPVDLITKPLLDLFNMKDMYYTLEELPVLSSTNENN